MTNHYANPGTDRRSPILPLAFVILALVMMVLAITNGVHGIRTTEKAKSEPDPRIDEILKCLQDDNAMWLDVIRAIQLSSDTSTLRSVEITLRLDELAKRKSLAVVEKITEKIVEKPVIIERTRVPPATLEAMREADLYMRMWWFVDDPDQNRHRGVALRKLAAAIADAEKMRE